MHTYSLFARALVSTLALPQDCWLMSETEKTTLKLVVYIDIKSQGISDALRVVLKDVQWVSLSGDKPAVCTITHVP